MKPEREPPPRSMPQLQSQLRSSQTRLPNGGTFYSKFMVDGVSHITPTNAPVRTCVHAHVRVGGEMEPSTLTHAHTSITYTHTCMTHAHTHAHTHTAARSDGLIPAAALEAMGTCLCTAKGACLVCVYICRRTCGRRSSCVDVHV